MPSRAEARPWGPTRRPARSSGGLPAPKMIAPWLPLFLQAPGGGVDGGDHHPTVSASQSVQDRPQGCSCRTHEAGESDVCTCSVAQHTPSSDEILAGQGS